MLCFHYTAMSLYKIHRMKEQPRQNFRWGAHTAGAGTAKPKDYEPSGEVEAASAYAAWSQLQETGDSLDVGDILEDATGRLRIFKYVGWEEAEWQLPEVKSGVEALPGAIGTPEPQATGLRE